MFQDLEEHQQFLWQSSTVFGDKGAWRQLALLQEVLAYDILIHSALRAACHCRCQSVRVAPYECDMQFARFNSQVLQDAFMKSQHVVSSYSICLQYQSNGSQKSVGSGSFLPCLAHSLYANCGFVVAPIPTTFPQILRCKSQADFLGGCVEASLHDCVIEIQDLLWKSHYRQSSGEGWCPRDGINVQGKRTVIWRSVPLPWFCTVFETSMPPWRANGR